MKLLIAFIALVVTGCRPGGSTPTATLKDADNLHIETEAADSTDIAYITGRFDPSEDGRFDTIPKKFADRQGMYIRKEALEAFKKMHAAALRKGIRLVIRSAARNFDYQKGIWERKWKGETVLSDGVNAATDIADPKARALKILEYSSMPGTSRHHWGTDIDLNSFDNNWFASGEGLALYNWMKQHAAQYGFCQPYTAKGEQRPHGYNEEKWHWSYVPLSRGYTEIANKHLHNDMISGFSGSGQAEKIDVVKKYVLGINKNCL